MFRDPRKIIMAHRNTPDGEDVIELDGAIEFDPTATPPVARLRDLRGDVYEVPLEIPTLPEGGFTPETLKAALDAATPSTCPYGIVTGPDGDERIVLQVDGKPAAILDIPDEIDSASVFSYGVFPPSGLAPLRDTLSAEALAHVDALAALPTSQRISAAHLVLG
jgi:hypothetical protein